MKAVVIGAGAIQSKAFHQALLREADLIIAADGGARAALRLGVVPHVIVGDFDSLDERTRQRLRKAGATLLHDPRKDDRTDMEWAIDEALRRGARQVTVIGALGGPRLDHALANVLLLLRTRGANADIRIVDEQHEVFLVGGRATIRGEAGWTVTLLPLSERVEGVTTRGLAYPLRDEPLTLGSSRSVSNRMTGTRATVSVRDGLLLVVLYKGSQASARRHTNTG